MATSTSDHYVELIGTRQVGTPATVDDSRTRGRVDMNRKGSIDALEHALANHVAGTVKPLLTRLKHETNPTAQFALVGTEEPCCADQHRDMRVMPTGMHTALYPRLEGQICILS
jgi:hypothetical protein